jgi:hypothetical protein
MTREEADKAGERLAGTISPMDSYARWKDIQYDVAELIAEILTGEKP